MWNPPTSTARGEGKHEDSVTNDGGPSSCGADTMSSFSSFTSSVDRPELKNQNNRVFLDLNHSTDFMTGANSVDVNNIKSEFNREPDISYPDRNDNVTADCSMSFMLPWCDPAASYPIKSHGAEAKTGRISNRPQISGNFGITGNHNDDDDITVFPHPFISSRHMTGDFLSLGVGDGAEIKPKGNFSTQDIASKLEDQVHVSPQCKSSIVGQIPTNAWNLDPYTGLAVVVRTDGGGLSSSTLAGSSGLNPIKIPGLDAELVNPQCDNFVIDSTELSSSSLSSPSGYPVFHQRGRVSQRPIDRQIYRPTSLASQFIPRQQQYNRNCMNASFESSRNNLSDSLKRSSISHAQLGTLTPLTETRQNVAAGCFPGGVRYRGIVQPLGNLTLQVESTSTGFTNICPSPECFQPVVHSGSSRNFGPVAVSGNSLFPRSIGLPIQRGSTIQSASAGPFPRRLGVQPNEPTVRTIGGQHHHGMPTQLPTDFTRSDHSSVTHLPDQASPVRPIVSSGPFFSHQHLKRRATGNPSTKLSSKRRNISNQHVIHHPATGQRPSFRAPAPATSHVRTAPYHIKWQGFDEPLEPSGHKCLLCKRDISFTPEGQVYQPDIPPAVAVLACGHTFHEDCLQRITLKDYSIDPPCIPCALGEM